MEQTLGATLGAPRSPGPTAAESSAPQRRFPERTWTRQGYALIAAVSVLVGVHRAEMHLSDTDVLWGARAGMHTLTSGRLVHTDTYSWTAYGRPWVPNSWGWNVVLGAAYRAAGVLGIYLVGLALALGLCCAVALAARRIGATPVWTAMVLAAIGPITIIVAPRAQTPAMILMLAIPPLLPRILLGNRLTALRATAAVAGIHVLWINVHTSAVLGPAILVAGGIGLIAQSQRSARRPAAWRLLGAFLASAAGCFATPYGAAPVWHIAAVARASTGLMQEWEHPGLSGPLPIFGSIAVVAGLGAAYLAWRARRWDALGILLLLSAATAEGIRFAPLVAVFAMPQFAVAGARLAVRPHMLNRILAAGCAVLLAMVLAGARSFATLGSALASPALVAELPSHCRLVNDMLVGGAVILLRPDVLVSLDSRNDMYGRKTVLADVDLLANAQGTGERINAAGVNCVLAYSAQSLVLALSHDPGWRVVDTDTIRTLLVRRTPVG